MVIDTFERFPAFPFSVSWSSFSFLMFHYLTPSHVLQLLPFSCFTTSPILMFHYNIILLMLPFPPPFSSCHFLFRFKLI